MFVSQASVSLSGTVPSYGLNKQIEVVKNCRKITKTDLKFNSATPKLDVDPNTFVSAKHPAVTIALYVYDAKTM